MSIINILYLPHQPGKRYKKRLESTEKLIENARKNGWERQVEKNLPIAENLRKIIRGLEQKDVIHGDEKFPEQGGEPHA